MMFKMHHYIEQYLYKTILDPEFTLETISIHKLAAGQYAGGITGGLPHATIQHKYNADFISLHEYFAQMGSSIECLK